MADQMSYDFPSASYDSWKTTPPDYYDEDPDWGDEGEEDASWEAYSEAFIEWCEQVFAEGRS